jgi:hypothetical protein
VLPCLQEGQEAFFNFQRQRQSKKKVEFQSISAGTNN